MTAHRKLAPGRLIAATHNKGKAAELTTLLAETGFTAVSAGELGLAEPEETADTFRGNAELKALAAAKAAGEPALADDSGLACDGLSGAPGIYSARWAGPAKDFRLAMQKVEDGLKAETTSDGEVDKRASFVCVLSLAWPDGHVESFEGVVRGQLVFPPRGEKGFGYDPIFVPEGETETFGEMDPDKKHHMSHRAVAFARLKAFLMA
ncbi:MAG TPA: RdgB/HAM1 family non-canonical purine NTP pyrophosphatase [Candidatus Polarisedimenticolia bacterium]|nr:RdgB/HAM1 family non-canonical purine NTP pyrophosphatase [Candidatus Polarisedimenticolia bacterium]